MKAKQRRRSQSTQQGGQDMRENEGHGSQQHRARLRKVSVINLKKKIILLFH
jgi:hypothetical protein